MLRSARSGATLPARTRERFVDGPGETKDGVQARHLEHLPHGPRQAASTRVPWRSRSRFSAFTSDRRPMLET